MLAFSANALSLWRHACIEYELSDSFLEVVEVLLRAWKYLEAILSSGMKRALSQYVEWSILEYVSSMRPSSESSLDVLVSSHVHDEPWSKSQLDLLSEAKIFAQAHHDTLLGDFEFMANADAERWTLEQVDPWVARLKRLLSYNTSIALVAEKMWTTARRAWLVLSAPASRPRI